MTVSEETRTRQLAQIMALKEENQTLENEKTRIETEVRQLSDQLTKYLQDEPQRKQDYLEAARQQNQVQISEAEKRINISVQAQLNDILKQLNSLNEAIAAQNKPIEAKAMPAPPTPGPSGTVDEADQS